MDFRQLEQNVTDVIKEEQIKLGYRRESIRLYYPLQSLNTLLNANLSIEKMKDELTEFFDSIAEKLGKTKVSNDGERFCLYFDAKASEYIHLNTKSDGFLYDFINTISKHGCTIEEVLAVFYRYSSRVHAEKIENDDFDYLVYFEDGNPDAFRYCITDEGCHIIYHRYTKQDYDEIR